MKSLSFDQEDRGLLPLSNINETIRDISEKSDTNNFKAINQANHDSFLNSINQFRAIAIIFVVAGHCFEITGMQFNSLVEKSIANLITGGTFLFVFISGFMFHHVFYKKFQYKQFLIGKVKNVLIPYIFLGILPISLFVSHKTDGWGGFFQPQGLGVFYEYITPALKYYFTGAFLTAYWYIPFIMLMFLMSPLYFRFVQSKLTYQLSLILPLCGFSLFIHRPIDNINIFQSVIYFIPVYLIGIVCSINKNKIYEALAGKELILLAIVFFLAALEATSSLIGNYHKSPFVYGGVDLMFIQKIILSLFFMIYLHRFELLKSKYLHLLAASSFAVYFLHPFIIWIIKAVSHQYLKINSWVLFLALVILVILLNVFIAEVTKKMLPKHSRFLIGY